MNIQMLKNIDTIKKIALLNKWNLFENNSKCYNLNIWNVRSSNRIAGKFDDIQLVFFRDKQGNWIFETFEITTDPSEISLVNMKNKLGVAIVKRGQYIGAWRYGEHKGQYPALVQRGNITVIRDFTKDAILDIPSEETLANWYRNPANIINIKRKKGRYIEEYISYGKPKYIIETGYDFGINCHRASAWKISEKIGLYSEGCIVHKNVYKYNDVFIPLIQSAAINWGSDFSFVMCDEKDFSI